MDGPFCLTGGRVTLYSGWMENVSLTHLPESEDIFQMIYSSGTWWDRLFHPKIVAKRAAHKIVVDIIIELAGQAAQEKFNQAQSYRDLLDLRSRDKEKRRTLLLIFLDIKRQVSAHLNTPDADDRAFISNLEVNLYREKV